MRLSGFGVCGRGPIKRVEVSDLSDVVVLAGPNGVGKTNVNNALLEIAQQPQSNPNTWITVEATTELERTQWKKNSLDTRRPNECSLLAQTLQRNQRRNKYRSSFLNFDSDRAVRNVQSFNFSWDIVNPYEEDVSWNTGWQPLSNRYNDVRHSLFRLVESQKKEIADRALSLRDHGQPAMALDFPDVLKSFKEAFEQLLAPKRLVDVDVRSQQIFYELAGTRLAFDTLSSGEREVINVVFDFLLRGPRDCVIIFDEPELHLHPELSYKLLQALSRVGERNQFIFSSHSPEIISASLENTVVFITPVKDDTTNQAVTVHRDDETHHALQTLGQSIGIISLGKKLILVEGEESSLDKQTYGAILKSNYPEFVLVPVGGKDSIRSFDDVRENILSKTLWGVDFYMLCDRDAQNALGRNAVQRQSGSGRVVLLPRYHLENYFLDERVLAAAFEAMEPDGSWLRDPSQIKAKLISIARQFIPYAVALIVNATIRERVGNVSLMPKGVSEGDADNLVRLMNAKLQAEGARVSAGLDAAAMEQLIRAEFSRLTAALDNDDPIWRADLPGRPILHQFAAAAKIQSGRLKQTYLRAAEGFPDTFSDINAIFAAFREA